ncbi:hypothetical protein ACEWY4_007722 [Coilia grayii]|uniref:ribonuclease H n=1 Tax=Coilia grayii TaxID=363190 RepID=A0ABD1K911_9TELE
MPSTPHDLSTDGAGGDDGGSYTLGTSLHEVCKRAAEKLNIPWPNAEPEKSGSRYEGKRLPRAKSAERQLLPLFPECLEEATRTWSKPYSAKNPIQGGAALDCVAMDENGLSKLPPVEPLVAHHLHPGQKTFSDSSAPSFPSKADGFHSSVTDKAYRALALGVRALNASSMLMAYQAELQDETAGPQDAQLWDEMRVVTDLCLRLHRCAVQASRRAMGFLVTQERARWLTLSSLSHREKVQLLDVAVDPKGLFGPAMASMQRRCEEKKREGEALQTCLPRKSQAPPAPTPRPSFAQVVARPTPGYRIPKRTVTQPKPAVQPKAEGGGTIAPLSEGSSAVGTLAQQIRHWRTCVKSNWVLRTIEKGYRLQFAHSPPRFSRILYSQAEGAASRFLQAEITSLLEKKAIQIVPPTQSQSGFYSRYFVVPKKGGGMRPILDLRALNRHLRRYRFRMLTHASLLKFVRPGDWFTTLDLADAYFHIQIYPPHRKYLRFAFEGVIYEYLVLPFGLALSPRVFVKCTDAAVGPLRTRGIRLAIYLDDCLLAGTSAQEAIAHTECVMTHLSRLGFKFNLKKSVLLPTQSINFIGLSLDSNAMRARLSQDRTETMRACLAQFRRGNYVRLRDCHRLLGLMASALVAVPLGRLHMRGFQRWVAQLKLDPHAQARHKISVTSNGVLTLRQWKEPMFLTRGAPLGTICARSVITTDASRWGWGATHEGRLVNGQWDSSLQTVHINVLELMAVFLALRHFLPHVENSHVLVRTDNTTVVAYINKQGGLRSPQLHRLARKLILWSQDRLLSLKATHVPGVENRGADLLSRGHPRYGEWKLHLNVTKQIWQRFGYPTVDLYASAENAHCPLFFSLTDTTAPLGVDALAHPWPRTLLYAFPPLALITPTLERVRTESHTMILIAPNWPQKHWLAEITGLLYAQPWPLPLQRDLLSQAQGEIFHPHPERLALWAWPVRG